MRIESDSAAGSRASTWVALLQRGIATLGAVLFVLLCAALFGVALFGSLAGAAPAAAPPVDKAALTARCLGCHDDATLKTDAGKSLAIHGAEFAASAHKRAACVDCHADALTVRHPRENLGPVDSGVCVACHEDELKAVAASVHGAGGAIKPESCTDCHGDVHTARRSKDPDNSMTAVNQIRTCGGCHKKMMKGYLASEHAHALLAAGLTGVAPSCTSCHGTAHDIKKHDDAAAATSFAKTPETCGSCHKGVLERWNDSAHGKLWQSGKHDGPVCTTCHEAHAIKAPDSAEMRQRFPSDCKNCHAEVYRSFADSFHGKATGLGYTAVAMCADCHTPHQNLPASDPKSSINPANRAATCGKCHAGQVNAAFLSFDPHSNPRDPHGNPWVHYTWLFMTLLLLGVFGFFGVHALLWLQRSLVGRLRGEFPRHKQGPYVRRFSTFQIEMHVIIILSFLLLAATGLPLKFSAAPWAPQLMALLGGPRAAGVLHRIAAVITFGYFGAHVLALLLARVVRKEHGFIWGWRSMTPQARDILDLLANVRYFLYLGPRPKFDRWTYWEKFDYLAVFWGVAMIGASGLLLWFPGIATRFLPGWALNAAYVIHSDEALLATGFIFLFHFFHTHLRPETFPMDPVVFTGRQPLDRLKEERPLEYQRLVADGKLESLIVPAPDQMTLLRAYVFGFTAVAIGIALAIAIFVALLSEVAR
jgi:cytochrome b subunit of formate dehydrogenase